MTEDYHLHARVAGLEANVNGLRDRTDLIMSMQEKALEVAKREVDHRLEGMNNFQHRIDRTENLMATKSEVLSLDRRVADRVDGFEVRVKSDQLSMWRIIWIGVGIILSLEIVFNLFVRNCE